MNIQNAIKLLKLSPPLSVEEVERAFKKQAFLHHPDKYFTNSEKANANKKFIELCQAREVLRQLDEDQLETLFSTKQDTFSEDKKIDQKDLTTKKNDEILSSIQTNIFRPFNFVCNLIGQMPSFVGLCVYFLFFPGLIALLLLIVLPHHIVTGFYVLLTGKINVFDRLLDSPFDFVWPSLLRNDHGWATRIRVPIIKTLGAVYFYFGCRICWLSERSDIFWFGVSALIFGELLLAHYIIAEWIAFFVTCRTNLQLKRMQAPTLDELRTANEESERGRKSA